MSAVQEHAAATAAPASAATAAYSRPSRARKQTERLAPVTESFAAKKFSYTPSGSGTPLGDIPFFRYALDKLSGDDDVLIQLHTLLFGSAGKGIARKRQIRVFSGYAEDTSRSTVVKKVTNSKKWTVSVLRGALGLCGLEKGGTRDEIVARLVDYLFNPTEVCDVPVPKAKKSKKRKAVKKSKKSKKDKKGDQPKRALSPFMLFSQAKRATIKEENPEASFGDIARLVGALWKGLEAEEKAIWEAAAAAATRVSDSDSKDAAAGAKKKRRKKEATYESEDDEVAKVKGDDSDDDESDDESDDDAADDNEEEEEEDRDKDLFPDSDDEA